jgi:hypothetical protein
MTSAREIKALDDAPNIARIAARQEFLNRWYKPVAMAPFVLVLIVATKLFPDSTSRISVYFVFASLAWVLLVVGYAIFLRFAVRCPVCGWRFGVGDKCSSCGLPRHRDADQSGEVSIT